MKSLISVPVTTCDDWNHAHCGCWCSATVGNPWCLCIESLISVIVGEYWTYSTHRGCPTAIGWLEIINIRHSLWSFKLNIYSLWMFCYMLRTTGAPKSKIIYICGSLWSMNIYSLWKSWYFRLTLKTTGMHLVVIGALTIRRNMMTIIIICTTNMTQREIRISVTLTNLLTNVVYSDRP